MGGRLGWPSLCAVDFVFVILRTFPDVRLALFFYVCHILGGNLKKREKGQVVPNILSQTEMR